MGEVEREGNLEGSWRSVRRKRRRMANQGERSPEMGR